MPTAPVELRLPLPLKSVLEAAPIFRMLTEPPEIVLLFTTLRAEPTPLLCISVAPVAVMLAAAELVKLRFALLKIDSVPAELKLPVFATVAPFAFIVNAAAAFVWTTVPLLLKLAPASVAVRALLEERVVPACTVILAADVLI